MRILKTLCSYFASVPSIESDGAGKPTDLAGMVALSSIHAYVFYW